jgi:hypothetical protein
VAINLPVMNNHTQGSEEGKDFGAADARAGFVEERLKLKPKSQVEDRYLCYC